MWGLDSLWTIFYDCVTNTNWPMVVKEISWICSLIIVQRLIKIKCRRRKLRMFIPRWLSKRSVEFVLIKGVWPLLAKIKISLDQPNYLNIVGSSSSSWLLVNKNQRLQFGPMTFIVSYWPLWQLRTHEWQNDDEHEVEEGTLSTPLGTSR